MKLSEVCLNIVDCPHSTAPDEGSGYALVRTPNIGKGRFNLEGVHRISEAAYKKRCARITPTVNDLILAREAPAGNVAIIKENMEPLALGQRTVLIRPNPEKVCPDFLVYYLLAPQQQNELLGRATGATVAYVNIPIINNLPVFLPPLETQQKIAGILSAYDDLIENNRKQIKLLEEAAQKLYKEWFVKLNFPGHENVKIVDGVPEGWKILTVEDLIGKLESGSRPKGGIDSTIKKGIASVGAENVIGLGQYNYSSEKFVNKEFYENAKRGKIEDKDILIYKDGAYIGRTSLFQDNFPHKETMINEHVFLLHAREESNQYFLFFTLYQRTYFEKMQKLNKNAAQPGQDAIKSLKFLMPAGQLLREFDNFVTPIVKRIFVLAKQNSQLQSARDKLLPRLMNGEI